MISRISDIGRIIAVSAIFYFHTGGITSWPFYWWGEYAVTFFILLSGVAYSCFSSTHPDDFCSYRKYVLGRLKAIFPIFFFINLAIFAASYLHPSALDRPFTFAELLASCTGVSQYLGWRYMSTVMWFVPFIIQAYLLFPLIAPLIERFSGTRVVLAAFVVSTPLVMVVFLLFPWPARICAHWSVIFRLPEVCLGVIIGMVIKDRRALRPGLVAIAVSGTGLSILALAGRAYTDATEAKILALPLHGLLISLGIVAVSIAAAAILAGPKNTSALRLIGTASFPFFLLHGAGVGFVGHRFGPSPAAWVSYYGLCWVAAILFTVIYRRLDRAWWSKSSPKAQNSQ